MRKQSTYLFLKEILPIVIVTLFLSSCSVTRHLESDEQLLVKNKIKSNNRKLDTDEMFNYIKQKPNRKTFGILFHHRVYNLYKNNPRKIGSWIRETIGEEPVIFDSLSQAKSHKQLQFYMHERGYYNARIVYKKKEKGFAKKKVVNKYKIESDKPYIVNNIIYNIADTNIARIIQYNKSKSAFDKHKLFDLKSLKSERTRLATLIRNHGYYSISENDIYFTADTTGSDFKVDLTIGLKPNKTPQQLYKKYKIQHTRVYCDFVPEKLHKGGVKIYTVYSLDSNTTYMYYDSLYVKPKIIERANYIKNGSIYKLSLVNRTQKQLSKNKLFKIVNISFEEVQGTDSAFSYIDCIIRISPVTRQAFTIEIEGTNTVGDWGAELNISYTHKNLLQGAENLQVRLTTAGEYNKALKTKNESAQLFNTYEYGIEVRLEIPKFLSPLKPEKFDLNYKPTTSFRAAYNFMKTPDYTRPTSQFSYGYTWFGNNYLTHHFNPIDVSYINYYHKSDRFNEFVNSREYYRYSYEDYMIYSLNYALVFYNKNPKTIRNYQFFKFYLESSGNLMQLAGKTFDWENNNGQYKTFDVVFAQYLKVDADYRYYKVFDKKKSFVTRLFGGIALPYGNSEGAPSVKKYYAGGANSLRGWSSRTLGPGAFTDTLNGLKYYLGDIKLEANLEARFDMFWIIEGAIFLDIGNIWSYNDNELSGAQFSAESFISQMAMAAGYGFRFDFSFFVFRTDIGVKLREPIPIEGTNSHIIWGNRNLTKNDFNINIGIGYPF